MHIWRRHGWQALFMQQKYGTIPNILAFFRWYAVSVTWLGVYNIGGNNTQMFPSYSYLWPVLYLRFIFKMFEQNDLGAFFFLEGSHVHCAYIRAFKKWIVVCQKEKDKRIPSRHCRPDAGSPTIDKVLKWVIIAIKTERTQIHLSDVLLAVASLDLIYNVFINRPVIFLKHLWN